MKVIKKATAKTKAYRVDHSCGAVLLVEDADCRYIPDQRDGSFYLAKCPECDGDITIAATLVKGWHT